MFSSKTLLATCSLLWLCLVANTFKLGHVEEFVQAKFNISPKQTVMDAFSPDLAKYKHTKHIHQCYDPSFGTVKLDLFEMSIATIVTKFFIELGEPLENRAEFERAINQLMKAIKTISEKITNCLECVASHPDNNTQASDLQMRELCFAMNGNAGRYGLTSQSAYDPQEYRAKAIEQVKHLRELGNWFKVPDVHVRTASTSRIIRNHIREIPFGKMKVLNSKNETVKIIANPFMEYPSFRSSKQLLIKAGQYAKDTHACELDAMQDSNRQLPASFDYMKYAKRTPVRYQGKCASCFMHATVSTVETQAMWRKLIREPLSVQEILNCHPNACNTGYMQEVYKFIAVFGMATESQCPYQTLPKEQVCYKYPSKVFVKGFCARLNVADDNQLKVLLMKKGPLTILFDVESMLYFKGKKYFKDECSPKPSHGGVLVGWEDNYWIIKNSYGTNWGLNGYIWVSMKAGNNSGCGVRELVAYPIF